MNIDLKQFEKYTLTKSLVFSFFSSSEKKEKEKEESKADVFFDIQNDDKLFWIYYVLINGYPQYKMVKNYFLEEKKQKINLVQTVKNNKNLLKKIKETKANVESNLLNDKLITIETFLYLCLLKGKNVRIIDNIKYLEYCENAEEDMNILNYNKIKLYESLPDISKLLRVDNWKKPVKSISAYKIAELRVICQKVGINVEKIKKKQLYNMLQIKLNRENI